MNEFKYQFVNIILLVLLGSGVYWAFNSIDNGIIYDKNVVVNEDASSGDKLNQGQEEIVLFENTKSNTNEVDFTVDEKEDREEVINVNDNQELINKLQKLIDNNVTMDNGSRGENVGVVQEFLAHYFTDKDIRIDKDFGPTTKGLVKEFQQKELGGGAGNIGPNTLNGMIKWLKK